MKYRFTISSLLVLLSLFLWDAQGNSAGAAQEDNMLYPSGAWLIGPSSLVPVSGDSRHDGGLPCIMMNQYNNGFTVRISGGGGRIMAMAMDFRQDVFKKGNDYPVNLRVPEQGFDVTLPAHAYNSQSLLFGTKETTGLYDALKNAKAFDVTVGSRTVSFVMAGIADGVARMEQCYNGGATGHVPERGLRNAEAGGLNKTGSALPSLSSPSRQRSEASGSREDAEKRGAALQEEQEEEVLIPMPSLPDAEDIASGISGQAGSRKGEDAAARQGIDAALEKAGEDISALAPSAGAADADDTAFSGKTPTEKQYREPRRPQPETDMKLAQNERRPEGRNMTRHWQSPYNMDENESGEEPSSYGRQRAPQDILIPPPVTNTPRFERRFDGGDAAQGRRPSSAYGDARHNARQDSNIRRWRAIRGANLRETLHSWSREENARLLWQADRDYPVEESFIVQGTYEEAVARLLEQYRGGDRGDSLPAGRIYNDPAAQQKVLLIETP